MNNTVTDAAKANPVTARPQPHPPGNLPLFRTFPALAQKIPHVPLGSFPTPVDRLPGAGIDCLYIKRDDLTGEFYGGNKVRKLEFLLGQAQQNGAGEVVTIGFAGSNHALATAIYAHRLGLHSTSMLMPQPNAHYVRRNLLASHHYGAELRYCGNAPALGMGILVRMLQGRLRHGRFPHFIPGGGSCPLGVTGYVNAAFELKDQINAGALPEPDSIYLPLGSTGTSVGLALGLEAAGLKSRVMAVRVIGKRWSPASAALRLLSRTRDYLRNLDPAFPAGETAEDRLTIRDDCMGEGYAHFTPQGVHAAALLRRSIGVVLNGSYSAKAFSAVLGDAAKGLLKGQTALFWNTYNSRDLSPATARVDYRQLPKPFHRYFEEDVQPLDKDGFDR